MRNGAEIATIKDALSEKKVDAYSYAQETHNELKLSIASIIRKAIEEEMWSRKEAGAYLGTNVAEIHKLMGSSPEVLSLTTLLKWANLLNIELEINITVKSDYKTPSLLKVDNRTVGNFL